MNAEPIFDRYYSIHFSRWPFRLFWKQMWRQLPLLAPLLFPILLLQRLPALRPDPAFATVYPEHLNPIPFEEIPARARNSLQSRIREGEELGFRQCCSFALETLGTIEQYDTLLLDSTGTILLQIRWFEMHVGNYSEQDTCLFCASRLTTGGTLSSTVLAKQHDMPEMHLPDDQSRNYPVTTSLDDLVRYHREALPDRTQLRHDDCDSMLSCFRERTKQLVDYLLEQRVFFELSPQQIHKLQKQDAERSA